jgi:3-oxoacyl-[acyl-carrier-protein] synthase-1
VAKTTGCVKVQTIYTYADALISPLGKTTDQNWEAMVEGRCGIERHEGIPGFPDLFWGALIPDQMLANHPELDCFTKFERLLILATQEALSHTDIQPSSGEVVFIIATTKGNIELIDPERPHSYASDRVFLWKSAQLVSEYFKNPNRPIVVSQACISGVSALLVGMEMLQQSCYKYAVIIGADLFSRFTFSGFSSLYALAPERCRPFDVRRQGLNLGEAAACMVLGKSAPKETKEGVKLRYGVVSNDAHHLSAPSRTGEGLYRAVMSCLSNIGDLPDFVNAHGTATVFNDEMEATVLSRTGLTYLPVTAFKGYFGHTLGAAGLIDVILSARCMEEGILLPVLGFETLGVAAPIQVQNRMEKRALRSCLKMAAGFGGSNIALTIER